MTTSRPKEDQNVWNFVFSLFFVGVLVAVVWAMQEMRGGFLIAVPVFDAFMMAFASFRITRLVVYDKITRWFRELFVAKREVARDGKAYIELVPYGSGFRHTMHDLLQCPWCVGLWSALVIVFFYFIFEWAWSIIFFLALAGGGSLLQVLANLIGWKAEELKRTTERL